MSKNSMKAPIETPAERAAPRTDLDTGSERGGSQDPKMVRRLTVKVISLVPAALATVAIYVFVIVHPVEHTPLATLQARFEQGNAAIWPMQLVWYASAAAIVGLALRPMRRASQLIYLFAAAYFAWIGFAYFAVLESGTHVAWVSGLWAVAFILEGMLFLVAGLMRRDFVIAPRRDLASVLGAVFISYALIAYPLIGLLSGQPPGSLPVIGLAPCPTSIFAFGLLLWARPPAPRYLLLIPLAWGLGSGPGAMSTPIVADFVLILAGVVTAAVLIWHDRMSSGQTVVAGLVLATMVAFSGHDDWLVVLALVLVAVAFVQTISSDVQPAQNGPGRLV